LETITLLLNAYLLLLGYQVIELLDLGSLVGDFLLVLIIPLEDQFLLLLLDLFLLSYDLGDTGLNPLLHFFVLVVLGLLLLLQNFTQVLVPVGQGVDSDLVIHVLPLQKLDFIVSLLDKDLCLGNLLDELLIFFLVGAMSL